MLRCRLWDIGKKEIGLFREDDLETNDFSENMTEKVG